MKNSRLIALSLMLGVVMAFSACANEAAPTNTDTSSTTTESEETTTSTAEVEEEAASGPVAFADVDMGLMSAGDEYPLFTFEDVAGDCADMGFPTNLTWDSENNVVKTADESYVEDWTAIDFGGNLRFDEVPVGDQSLKCVIKATSGVTTAQLTCSEEAEEEDGEDTEICTGTVKIYAQG